MTEALTANQLLELVDQQNEKLKSETQNKDKSSSTFSTLQNVSQFIQEIPNKLFWCSSLLMLFIGIICAEVAYHQDSWYHEATPSGGSDHGKAPTFTVFIFGIFICCGYLVCCFKEACYKKPKRDISKLRRAVDIKPKWTKQSTMFLIKKRIEGVVIDAFETECERKEAVDEKSRKQIANQKAKTFVAAGYKGVDIISQCQLECIDRRSVLLSLLFSVRNHYLWSLFMNIVVITHVAFSFYESKHIRNNDTKKIFNHEFYIGVNLTWKQAIPEFCLIAIELFDVIIRILWIHLCPTHILRAKSEKLYAYLNCVALLYIFADLIINLTFCFSIEYLIPVRPLLLILMNDALRREVATLMGSIYEILPVLRMYALVVIFVGIIAFIIFGDTAHVNEALSATPEDEKKEFTQNIECFWFAVRAIFTMFVFISSAENYTTVVYPGMQVHGQLVLLFFIPVIFLGMFTLTAMITGIFEDVFVKKEAINRMRDLWWKRTGIISAFILIDHNGDNLLTLDEFIDFVLFMRKKDMKRLQVIKLFKILDSDNSGTIELAEFVNGIERLCDEYNTVFDQHMIERFISSENKKQNNYFFNLLAVLELIWLSWTMNKLRGLLFVLNFWIFCWMNILEQNVISAITQMFLFIHIFDVFIKFIAMKPYRYLYLSKFNKNEIISEFGNRCDLFITLLCLIGFIVGSMCYPQNTLYFNICSALILLRVFIFWKVSLHFLFLIKSAFSSLSALFVVMFCVFFVYGVIGVSLFKGVTDKFEVEQNYMKFANFDSLSNAMVTLIQAFVGEAFHEIMLATKNSLDEDNWNICFYIVSYFLIMTLLFGNLFFGLLLSIFGCLYDIQKSGEAITKHTIKKVSTLRLMNDETDEDEDDVSNANAYMTEGGHRHTTDINNECNGADYIKSRARNESVTLDIVERIPEEMAHNLSIGDAEDSKLQMKRVITDFEPGSDIGEAQPVTPTQAYCDSQLDIEMTKFR